MTTNFFRSKGYQIFYGIGLHSHVLDVQELDAMNGIEHAVPCLQGAVLFKLSMYFIKFNRKMKPDNNVRWQMKISVVNYNNLRKN